MEKFLKFLKARPALGILVCLAGLYFSISNSILAAKLSGYIGSATVEELQILDAKQEREYGRRGRTHCYVLVADKGSKTKVQVTCDDLASALPSGRIQLHRVDGKLHSDGFGSLFIDGPISLLEMAGVWYFSSLLLRRRRENFIPV